MHWYRDIYSILLACDDEFMGEMWLSLKLTVKQIKPVRLGQILV